MADRVGIYAVELVVSDGLSASEPARAAVVALTPADLDPPVVTVTAEPASVPVGSPVTITVAATDDSGIDTLELTVGGEPLPLRDGQATFAPETAGRYEAAAVATDLSGNRGRAATTFYARSGADSGAPRVVLTAPVDGAQVDGAFESWGTVEDADLAWYALELSPQGAAAWTRLVEGAAAVTEGLLGLVDPPATSGGLYELRLVAEDAWGHRSETGVTIEIVPGRAFGSARIVFVDARVPLAGVPIEIRRTYDSGRLVSGDFGVGWTLDVGAGAFEQTHAAGEGWDFQGNCVLTHDFLETQSHRVTIRMGDDGYRFFFDPLFEGCVTGAQYAQARFTPLPGTRASLTPVGETALVLVQGRFFHADGLNPWEPVEFVLETEDGETYRYHRDRGILGMEDAWGHSLTVDEDGVRHSAGVSVTFERDAAGRITALTLPNGAARTYTYDGRGDLRTTVDLRGYETFYFYDLAHFLTRIVDPRGGVPMSIVYDESGRVVAYVDAGGNWIEIAHDPDARQEVITDRLGNVTVYHYDECGRVLETVDALGGRTTYDWDDAGNLLRLTDPLGNETGFSYDAEGHRTALVDASGERWTMAWESGRRTLLADPEGNTWRRAWDGDRATSATGPEGAVTTWQYGPNGLRTATIDAEGGRTDYTYTPQGALSTYAGSDGRSGALRTDAVGNVLGDSYTLDSADGPVEVAWTYEWDDGGVMTGMGGPDGERLTVRSDAIGQLEGWSDATERSWSLERDGLGRLRRHTGPDGALLEADYDAEDRLVAFTLPDGGAATLERDALGRVTRWEGPDGAAMEQTFDAAGRLASRTGPGGEEIAYTWDAVGRLVAVERADGALTRYERDRAGRVVSVTGPEGGVLGFERDGRGRITRTTYPDGATEATRYDGNGRPVRRTTRAGERWRYAWDDGGALASVTDPAGNVTSYGRDGDGMVDEVTDANGHTTRFLFSGGGNLLRRTLPRGGIEHYAYDEARRVVRSTDFAGQTTDFLWDAAGRLGRASYPDGSSVETEHDDAGRVTAVVDANGRTEVGRDAAGRITSWARPDGLVVRHAYDATGNCTAVTTDAGTTVLAYNGRRELVSVTDPRGQETSYSRDRAGKVTAVARPGGITVAPAYDAGGRVRQLRYAGADGTVLLEVAYVRDDAGRVVETSDSTGRTATYAYDAVDRLVEERLTVGEGAPRTTTWGHDAVGNRTARVGPEGSATLVYDADDRLLEDGARTYGWDANGRLASRSGGAVSETFAHDARGRLVRVDRVDRVDREGAGPARIDYTYTADDLLASRTADGETIRYVWDRCSRSLPRLLELRDGDGALVARFESGAGLLSRYDAAAERTAVYLTDGLGTVRGLVALDAGQIERHAYDAWGQPETSGPPPERGFLGELVDPATGLVYLRARWYAPDQGRFLEPDPVQGTPHDPRSILRYAYAANDPVNKLDPSGESLVDAYMTAALIATLVNIGIRAMWKGAEGWLVRQLGGLRRLRFQSIDGYLWPLGSFAATKGAIPLGIPIGFDLLFLDGGHTWALYAYAGLILKAGGGGFTGPLAGFGFVYDTPNPGAYEGWFVNVTVTRGFLESLFADIEGAEAPEWVNIHAVKRHQLFWSIYPWNPGAPEDQQRFAHGFYPNMPKFWWKGADPDYELFNTTIRSPSISVTWCYKVLETAIAPYPDIEPPM